MPSLFDQMQADAGGAQAPSLFAQMQADAVPAAPVVARQPSMLGSAAGGAIQGVGDVQNAGAQWLYNLMPKPVQDMGDAADHWLYDKTGGAVGTKPGMTFNNAVADQNANYEAARAGNGRSGIDWARAGGAGGAQALGALLMGPQTALTAGLTGGALTPVTSMSQGSDTSFGPEAAKNVALGGLLGKGLGMAGGAVAGAVSPQVDKVSRLLMNEGIQLTPGQMFGGIAKSVEDKLTSVPIVGDIIKGAQGRAVDGLNTAAYARVLAPLKEAGFDVQLPKTVGREGVDSITTSVKDAYNSLVPKLVLKGDAQLTGELGNLRGMAEQGLAGPQLDAYNRVMSTVGKNFTAEGISSGKTLQGMLSDLGKAADGYTHDPAFENQQLGAALKTAEQAIKDGLARSNPQYAAQLAKIDEAFGNLARVQSAAATQGAPNGVFTAAQLAAAVKGGDRTIRDNAYARGQARMQDLSDPAKTMLGSSVPNSGTSDRAMAAGATGALLANPLNMVTPAVLGGLLPSLAYTRPGVSALNFAATPRPPQVQALADALRKMTNQSAQPFAAGALTYGH